MKPYRSVSWILGLSLLLVVILVPVSSPVAADEVSTPLVQAVETPEAEAALLDKGEIETELSAGCVQCPMYPDDCSTPQHAGFRCSERIFNCSCGYCQSLFTCIAN